MGSRGILSRVDAALRAGGGNGGGIPGACGLAAMEGTKSLKKRQPLSSVAAMDVLEEPRPEDMVDFPEDVTQRFNAVPARTLECIRAHIQAGTTEAFNICNLMDVTRQMARWRAHLPRVDPYYAVKCNPDTQVLAALASAGAGFDCASKAEIDLLRNMGIKTSRIVYANPCKQPSHIKHAAAVGVGLTVFDCEDELDKLHALHPSAKLLLRILVDDSQAQCTMSQKYGAPLWKVPELLRRASNLDLDVTGVSFHVGTLRARGPGPSPPERRANGSRRHAFATRLRAGSGCRGPESFVSAVHAARQTVDMAAALGLRMRVVDIGGGFPGGEVPEPGTLESRAPGPATFEAIAGELGRALDTYFPAAGGFELVAEPGRFFVSSSTTLVTNVIGRKADSQGNPMYFVDDGLYGSFNCILYDHAKVYPHALGADGGQLTHARAGACSVWGPTCDGLDCIVDAGTLPPLRVGDWLCWPNMGAYTSAAGSTFNGMARPPTLYA